MNKKIANNLKCIETKLVNTTAILEIVRESCLYNNFTNQEIALYIALNECYEIIEKINQMYTD